MRDTRKESELIWIKKEKLFLFCLWRLCFQYRLFLLL
nr:MAG TPA: hypothetical protein [Caudoviricetes sp.]